MMWWPRIETLSSLVLSISFIGIPAEVAMEKAFCIFAAWVLKFLTLSSFSARISSSLVAVRVVVFPYLARTASMISMGIMFWKHDGGGGNDVPDG